MAGYIRQSSFSDGDTITAALFNNEYNQLLNAFSNTSGHAHDGTTAEGPVIGLIGDAGETSPNNKVLIDTTNNFIEFYVEVSSAPVQQLYISDGAIIPVTDSDVDLGTTSLRFKDTYTDTVTTTGNVSVGGNLTVTGTTTFNGGTITMGDAATDNVVFGADIDSHIIPDDDDTYDLGSSTQQWRNLYVDGTANLDTVSIEGDATFADNAKAIFGAGSDLQIYHDGSNSYIKDNGTGTLRIQGSSSILMQKLDGEIMMIAREDGAVELYHNNSKKIETTSTGIDVTGTVLATRAEFGGIETSADRPLMVKTDTNNFALHIEENSGAESWQIGVDADGDLGFHNSATAAASVTFNDSGNVGIGTDSPTTPLTVNNNTDHSDLAIFHAGGGTLNRGLKISTFSNTDSNAGVELDAQHSSGAFKFSTGGSERVRIDSSGNVGIGTDSPNNYSGFTTLTLDGTSGSLIDLEVNGTVTGEVYADASNGVGMQAIGSRRIQFKTDNTERMRIDSSGNLLIGKTADTYSAAGVSLRANPSSSAALATFTRAGTNVISLNRLTDDGDIIVLTKDGTTVGSIGTNTGDIFLGTSDTFLRFNDSLDAVLPATSTGAGRDNAIDLGYSGARFKDLYLGNDAYFSDDGKAIFGTGSDLEIYHDGSTSYIRDSGTGSLSIRGTNLFLADSAGNSFIVMTDTGTGGTVEIKHNASTKLTTTSTGIDVTGTAVTDGLTVAGEVSIDGGSIKLDGNYPVGASNVALGNTALDSIASDGNNNTAIGNAALTANTTGDNNTGIGSISLDANTTGSQNTALGYRSLSAVTTASNNTAVGYDSLKTNTASNNTAIGYTSLTANTTGTNNVAMGYRALTSNTTGDNNTAIGKDSLVANTTGTGNTVMGSVAGLAVTTGTNNALFGYGAGDAITTSGSNVAVGAFSLSTATTAGSNTAVGASALANSTSGANLVAVGTSALTSNTTGTDSVGVGKGALQDNTTGSYNTALGYLALSNNTTANFNTAIGRLSMITNTTGASNTTLGAGALQLNTTGSNNVALGADALVQNTTGAQNVAVGSTALDANTEGENNVALGYAALGANTTADDNVSIGSFSLDANTTGHSNTAVGKSSLGANTTGSKNVCIGLGAGDAITTGSNNTIIGDFAGTTTMADTIVLASGTTERMRIDSSGKVGIGTTSPTDKLDVAAPNSQFRLTDTDDATFTQFSSSGNILAIRQGTTSGQHFYLNSSGNVGIGTSSPTTQVTASKSANISQVAITSSSNAVAWDATAAANAYYSTSENTTFSAPSNAVEGAIISVEIAQGGTARTVAWNTVFEFAASTAPTVTATANKTDIFSFRYNGSVWQEIGRVQNLAQT